MPGVLSAQHLSNKTVGFVAIKSSPPTPSSTSVQSRKIIAWAESGHGLGIHGDTLLAGGYAMANRKWAKLTIQLAKTLGINDRHPYDFGHSGVYQEERVGCFYAAHVEVKLATHAIHTLLKFFEIRHNPDKITRRTLAKLIGCRYKNGTIPVIEIYFSRRNCRHCERFITRLKISTGLQFRLIWKHRLDRIQFKNEMNQAAPGAQSPQEVVVIDDGDDEPWITSCDPVEIDAPDEDDNILDASEQDSRIDLCDEEDHDNEEDLEVIMTASSTPSSTFSSFVHLAQDASDSEVVMTQAPLTRPPPEINPIHISEEENTNTLGVIDLTAQESRKSCPQTKEAILSRWIDGIRFALGQAASHPEIARAATIDLARNLLRRPVPDVASAARSSTPQRAPGDMVPEDLISPLSVVTIRTRGRSRSRSPEVTEVYPRPPINRRLRD